MTDHDRPPRDGADARADHERFSDWDAAYVLGALSPSDRRAYEEHLATCPICTSEVGDLAGMPGLLASLPRDSAMALLDDGTDAPSDDFTEGAGLDALPGPLPDTARPAVPDLVPALLHRVRRRRRIRRWSVAAALVGAAAIAAVIALVVPAMLAAPPAASVATSLQQVTQTSGTSPLKANVTLTAKKWGTSIGMVCKWNADSSWSPNAGSTTRWAYGLWVMEKDGTSDRVATWTAGPGDVVRTTDSTSIPLDRITRIELRALDSDTVLLASSVHGAANASPAP